MDFLWKSQKFFPFTIVLREQIFNSVSPSVFLVAYFGVEKTIFTQILLAGTTVVKWSLKLMINAFFYLFSFILND